jgi:hypothetical protein
MSGSAVLLGNGQSPHSTYIQATGTGERIATKELLKAIEESATLHRLLLKYVQSFMVQTAHTAVANARAKGPERLARWLLMAQDRVGGDTLALTHEFLGLMLGVRRAGVTEAPMNCSAGSSLRRYVARSPCSIAKALSVLPGIFMDCPSGSIGG